MNYRRTSQPAEYQIFWFRCGTWAGKVGGIEAEAVEPLPNSTAPKKGCGSAGGLQLELSRFLMLTSVEENKLRPAASAGSGLAAGHKS